METHKQPNIVLLIPCYTEEAAVGKVIDDFKQVFGLRAGEGVPQPVIQNEQVNMGQGAQQLGIGAVGLGQGEGLQ